MCCVVYHRADGGGELFILSSRWDQDFMEKTRDKLKIMLEDANNILLRRRGATMGRRCSGAQASRS